MKNEHLISVIVPIYNVCDTLNRSVMSIINQTYKNLEIILVNDGSTDNSLALIKKLALKDDRIVVINQLNGGVSSARNAGLRKASGDYVGFVDPDDWIELDMFEFLLNNALESNSEISICGYVKEKKNGQEFDKNKEYKKEVFTSREALMIILDPGSFKGFTCNKLFKLESLLSKSLFFDEDIFFCEDLLFCCQAFLNTKTVHFGSSHKYHYVMHNTNASSAQYSGKKVSALKAIEKIIEILKDFDNDISNQFVTEYVHVALSLLVNGIDIKTMDEETKEYLLQCLRKYKLNQIRGIRVVVPNLICRINYRLLFCMWKFSSIIKGLIS